MGAELPLEGMSGMEQYDFCSMSFYQIWIRSFCDGNGDGIGDLYGVYDKLEYIRSLGVDGIWFSPIYPSPNADYGYDISDYKNVHPDYGDLEQFQKVLQKAHSLGLRVILDLVINHTSDEHPWFIESRKGKPIQRLLHLAGSQVKTSQKASAKQLVQPVRGVGLGI